MPQTATEPPTPSRRQPGAARHCAIGPFMLDLRGEILFHGTNPLPIGRRGVALLIRLLQPPGEVVDREALMQAGWHSLAVEESNLATQISALRRLLAQAPGGAGWIQTLPRRGYRFTGPADWQNTSHDTAPATAAPSTGPSTGPPTVAVLPFTARDPTLAEFAEGLAEDVVSMLASLRELVVISRASTLAAHARGPDVATLGQTLGVRYLVSGTIRRTEDGLRVLVELADCATGTAIWSHSFDTRPDLALDAPVPIVALIVNTLAPRVREQELQRVRRLRTHDLTVHQLLLQARMLMAGLLREPLAEAKVLIDRAIARDAGCAQAYAMAAEWHSHQISQAWTAATPIYAG